MSGQLNRSLDHMAEANEYKAAFIEVMDMLICINGRHAIGRLMIPPIPLFLYEKAKREESEKIKASFKHFISNLSEQEKRLLIEANYIGDGYDK
jgi:hypothetical protein